MKQLVKKFIPRGLFKKIEPTGHKLEAMFVHAINGFPARGMKVIGVTGTNGKTSTSYMIHRMLTDAGLNTGLMTTVAYGVNDDIHPQIHHMTNVPVRELVERLKWMKSQGVDWVVLESTSHGLAQHRLWGIPYSVAVMTNVTHEHLDYHGTFENYRDAKRMLFKMTNKNTKGLQAGIINAEDPSAELFASDIKHPVLYGEKAGELRAHNVKLTSNGSRYQVSAGDETYYIECRLPGSFNVYNSLAAVGVGRVLGLTKEQIEKGITALVRVEGQNTPASRQGFVSWPVENVSHQKCERVMIEVGLFIAVVGAYPQRIAMLEVAIVLAQLEGFQSELQIYKMLGIAFQKVMLHFG